MDMARGCRMSQLKDIMVRSVFCNDTSCSKTTWPFVCDPAATETLTLFESMESVFQPLDATHAVVKADR